MVAVAVIAAAVDAAAVNTGGAAHERRVSDALATPQRSPAAYTLEKQSAIDGVTRMMLLLPVEKAGKWNSKLPAIRNSTGDC